MKSGYCRSKICDRIRLVRKERLELSRVTPLEPKSSASTSSATFACPVRIGHYTRQPPPRYSPRRLGGCLPKYRDYRGSLRRVSPYGPSIAAVSLPGDGHDTVARATPDRRAAVRKPHADTRRSGLFHSRLARIGRTVNQASHWPSRPFITVQQSKHRRSEERNAGASWWLRPEVAASGASTPGKSAFA